MTFGRRFARLTILALLAGAGVLAATNCSELTELVVVVDSDIVDVARIEVTAGGQARSLDLTPDKRQLTLSVQAGSDPNAEVNVEATGRLRDGVVIAASARVRLSDGERQLVHLSLCRSCLAAGACEPVTTTEEFTGALPSAPSCRASNVPPGGGTDAGADATTTCPGGNEMALITTPRGQRFCIDRLEVSIAQYKTFVAADASLEGQPAECGFNTDYGRAAGQLGPSCDDIDPVASAKQPVSCVDWCDAYAYCKQQGKHLCGKIGSDGDSFEQPMASDTEVSEWYAACSNGGEDTYPYGDTYDERRCNGGDGPSAGILWNVGSQPGCATAKHDVRDMIGNVLEWENTCAPAKSLDGAVGCAVRGGSAAARAGVEDYLRCNDLPGAAGPIIVATRGAGRRDIGFRCCANPLD